MTTRALRGQLGLAFSITELRELIEMGLNERAEAILAEGETVDEAAGTLVAWAQRRGRLCDLAAAAAAARPQNEVLGTIARLMAEAGQREAGRVGTPGGGSGKSRMGYPDESSGMTNGGERRLGEQLGGLKSDMAHMQEQIRAMNTQIAQLTTSVQTLVAQREKWTPGLWYVAVFAFGAVLAAGLFLLAVQ